MGKPKVYLAAPILGHPDGRLLASQLLEALIRVGLDIVNPWVTGGPDAAQPREIYLRDTALIEAADGLVAEVTLPSLGVGYEIAYALCRGKPVAALAREGARVSRLIQGIQSPRFMFHTYADPLEAARLAAGFIGRGRPGRASGNII